jgi:hypothetical protein
LAGQGGGEIEAMAEFLLNVLSQLPSWAKTVMVLLVLAGPGIGGFLGAAKWGVRGGLTGLFAAYFSGLWFMVWIMMQMTRCRPEYGCDGGFELQTSWVEKVFQFLGWAAGAFAVSWHWHFLWIGFGVGCLYGGLAIRRRRARTVLPEPPKIA